MTNARTKSKKALERSSYEFMAAFILAAVTQIFSNWALYLACWCALASVGIYFCCYSYPTVSYGRLRKLFLSICWLMFVVSFAFNQIEVRYHAANVIPPPVQYLKGWYANPIIVGGKPAAVVQGNPTAYVHVDGRLLDKYKGKFELMAVAFHIMNGEDPHEKRELSKSDPVKIRAEDLYIAIPLNSAYLGEIEKSPPVSQFVLMAVPMRMRPGDFDTLNEAEDKGAQIIGEGSSATQVSGAVNMPGRQ